jgi:hypothetical protein
MGEEEKLFRFLSDDEFRALPLDDKLNYVTLAAQELEERQKGLRTLIKTLLSDGLPKR